VRSHILAAIAVLTLGAGPALADFVTVQYDFTFTEYNGTTASVPASGVGPADGITAHDLTLGPGLTAVTPADPNNVDALTATGWPTSGFNGDGYYTLRITSNGSVTFDLLSLVFGEQRMASDSPTNFSIRTDTDSFNRSVFAYGETDNTNHNRDFQFTTNPDIGSVGFADPFFTNASFTGLQSVEIRFYGYGGPGAYSLNNGTDEGGNEPPGGLLLTLETHAGGNPTPVPVPPSAVMLLTGVPGLLLLRRRLAG
jgi:hypothetical protein